MVSKNYPLNRGRLFKNREASDFLNAIFAGDYVAGGKSTPERHDSESGPFFFFLSFLCVTEKVKVIHVEKIISSKVQSKLYNSDSLPTRATIFFMFHLASPCVTTCSLMTWQDTY